VPRSYRRPQALGFTVHDSGVQRRKATSTRGLLVSNSKLSHTNKNKSIRNRADYLLRRCPSSTNCQWRRPESYMEQLYSGSTEIKGTRPVLNPLFFVGYVRTFHSRFRFHFRRSEIRHSHDKRVVHNRHIYRVFRRVSG